MPDYQEGKIYKIKGGDELYIGSTTDKLGLRFSCHKSNFNRRRYSNTSVFSLFEKYGIENCSIELIELFPCNTKYELFEREGFHIENNNCVNMQMPILTIKQKKDHRKMYNTGYRKKHKDELNKKSIQYRKDNVNKIEEQQSEKIECECGKKVRRDYLKKHKLRHPTKGVCD